MKCQVNGLAFYFWVILYLVIFLKTILLTGATGGIGKELCNVFANHGYSLILVGRNKEKLEQLKNSLQKHYSVSVFVILSDLSLITAGYEIYHKLLELNLEVDILCNNAGLGVYGDFLERNIEDVQELLQVNLYALLELCHSIGNKMKERRTGKIINVSSISAYFPGPYMATYYASKSYILSFSVALAKEVKPYGITVSVVCPGVIPTAFYSKANADLNNSYLLERMPLGSAKHLARTIYRKSMRSKLIIKEGILNKMIMFLSIFLFNRMKASIVSWVQRKK